MRSLLGLMSAGLPHFSLLPSGPGIISHGLHLDLPGCQVGFGELRLTSEASEQVSNNQL